MSTRNKTFISLIAAASMAAAVLSVSSVRADDDDVGEFAVTLEQATSIAMEQVPGTVLGAEVESEDGTTVWEVEIRDADGVIFEVELDANSGEVLEVCLLYTSPSPRDS